jgi:hypothetical protein
MFQLNCDLQLVLLEDGAAFPSQATKLSRHAFRWLRFGPYGYSVVRVNEILSCAVVVAWALIVVRQISGRLGIPEPVPHFNTVVILGSTLFFALFILVPCRRYPDVSFVREKMPLSRGTPAT